MQQAADLKIQGEEDQSRPGDGTHDALWEEIKGAQGGKKAECVEQASRQRMRVTAERRPAAAVGSRATISRFPPP